MQTMETTQSAGEASEVDRRALIQGLGDGRFRVRLACLCGLYSEGSREGVEASIPLLRDLRASVRAMAVSIVSNGILEAGRRSGHRDAVPLLIERIFQDESIKVRRSAVLHLAWFHAHPDLEGVFRQLLDEERDAKLHQWAGIGLVRCRAEEGSR